MFRFIHAADIHLDSPLRKLEAYEGAPVEAMRRATREALTRLVDLTLAEEAAFLVIAGDLFDGDWPDSATGTTFIREMTRLTSAGTPVFVLRGNHDAESRILRKLPAQDGVIFFDHRKPASHTVPGLPVVLHGQSFGVPAETANLAAGYPPPQPGMINIGVLHTALEGNARHAPYAPCSVGQLVGMGYDYWALGHVHDHAVVHADPPVVYPGNLQGRSVRETGPKGAVVVTVSDNHAFSLDFRPLDVARWADLRVDLTGCADRDSAFTTLRQTLEDAVDTAEGLILAVRLRLAGATPLHGALARDQRLLREEVVALIATLGADRVWLEKVLLETTGPAAARRAAEADALLALEPILAEAAADPELRAELAGLFDTLRAKVPIGAITRLDGEGLLSAEPGEAAGRLLADEGLALATALLSGEG